MNKSADETLKELLAGIAVYGVIAQMLCFLDWKHIVYTSLGLWTGIAAAALMAVHLKRTIEDALDLGEQGAVKHMRKGYAVRYMLTALVFGASAYYEIGNPITMLAGVMGLKIGAYLQPVTHRVLKNLSKGG